MDSQVVHFQPPTRKPRKQNPFSDIVEELQASIGVQNSNGGDDDDDKKDKQNGDEIEKYEMKRDSIEDDWDTDLEDEFDVKKVSHDMTGEIMYLKACKVLKIIPSNHVIHSLEKQVFNVRHRSIGPREIKAITEALVGNTFVKVLDLDHNNIGTEGINQILRLLIENCYITDISVSENNLGTRGADIFSDVFKYTRTLTKVNLNGNKFKDNDSSTLAKGIELNDTVKVLSLSHNEFRSAAGIDLGIAISKNNCLNELDLSWNHLRMDGAIALANGIGKNTSISKLNLKFNGFSDNGARAMGNALANNRTLQCLDLSYNRISDHGAIALSNGLAKNNTLRSLNVSYNPITKKGGLAMLKAAKEAEELIELLMDEIFLDTQAIDIIHQLVRVRTNLNITYSGVIKDSIIDGHKNELDFLKEKIFHRIREFLKRKRLRMLDLFNQWDKDKNLKLDKKEFAVGIEAANIPLSQEMIEFLMETLDADKNGQVEYDEFVAISGIQ